MLYNCLVNEFSQCPTEGAIGLLTLLIRSGRLAELRLDGALGAAGLTFVKWRTLDALVKATEPLPLGALAERLGCVKSNVTQLIDRLEADGIVRRAADPDDRRSILVELTDCGRAAHHAGREALEPATQALFASFGEDDRTAMRRLLGLLQA
jgi:DNA-binding MarR family transcriptional regulator